MRRSDDNRLKAVIVRRGVSARSGTGDAQRAFCLHDLDIDL
jgi:hypothetical protein